MKISRDIYLYRETGVPEHGWLQGCYKCEAITARIKNLKTVITEKYIFNFIVYICPHCQHSLTDYSMCDKFMEDYLG